MSKKRKSERTSGPKSFIFFDTETFLQNKKEFPHLEASVNKKLRFIKINPLYGEPLKHSLAGLRSLPVKYRFLIIYGICREHTQLQSSCTGLGENAVVFHVFGLHDDAYKIAKKLLRGKAKK